MTLNDTEHQATCHPGTHVPERYRPCPQQRHRACQFQASDTNRSSPQVALSWPLSRCSLPAPCCRPLRSWISYGLQWGQAPHSCRHLFTKPQRTATNSRCSVCVPGVRVTGTWCWGETLRPQNCMRHWKGNFNNIYTLLLLRWGLLYPGLALHSPSCLHFLSAGPAHHAKCARGAGTQTDVPTEPQLWICHSW